MGHPNLIRILNVEYMDYHPMRKRISLGRWVPVAQSAAADPAGGLGGGAGGHHHVPVAAGTCARPVEAAKEGLRPCAARPAGSKSRNILPALVAGRIAGEGRHVLQTSSSPPHTRHGPAGLADVEFWLTFNNREEELQFPIPPPTFTENHKGEPKQNSYNSKCSW